VRPQQASRLPDVIDGWLDIFAAVTADTAPDGPLKGVQLIDGPVKKMSQVKAEAIAIAAGDQNQPGASATQEQMPGLGSQAYAERVEVVLAFAVSGGGGDMKQRRARAREILAGIKAVVDANQVVANLWDQAFLGFVIDWYQTQNEAGSRSRWTSPS
jgi:hypothetical protein